MSAEEWRSGDLWTCETATAAAFTPVHLRRLTATGPHKGGGADTQSLCGRKVAWDVTPYRPEPGGHIFPLCTHCLEEVSR